MTGAQTHSRGAERWIADFEVAITERDSSRMAELFTDDAGWRDTGAFTWDYRQAYGRDKIEELLWAVADDIKPTAFRLSSQWPSPHEFGPGETPVVEFFFTFDTAEGRGTAIVRGTQDPASQYGFRAHQWYSRIDTLTGREQPEPHPEGKGFTPAHPRENWSQYRERVASFEDRDPQVLIVGGGHSGMMLAANLDRLGVANLIVDKNPRIGDNWRTRYHNLSLHTPTQMAQLPYLRYPENFPEYLSKDKLGDWLETYARSLDLNYWTSTEFLGGQFDEATQAWTASVRRADGSERVFQPRHIVLATGGVGGKPKIPALPGIEAFSGEVTHSSGFEAGEDYQGKKAIVVGVGTSAHDIAYDLHVNGADVTMVQRNPVAVVSIESANLGYSDFFNGVPDVLVDFRFAADQIFPMFLSAMDGYQAMVAERDGELLDRLEAAGLRLEDVNDGERSWFMKYFRNGGGYYLNIGTSDLIAEGAIKVVQSEEIETYGPSGAVLADGSTIDADVIVLATGYEDRQTQLVDFFGQDVAERVGPVGRGFDADGEWNNVWKPTVQTGLWFMLGGINNARPHSFQMAHLIAAELDGRIPENFRERAQAAGRGGSSVVPS